MARPEPRTLPLAARRAAWDALWRVLLAPPRPEPPVEPAAGGEGRRVGAA